jgi:glutathione S-transferase
MILRSSPPSPFGRKVSIAVDIAGLLGDVTIVAADTASETDSLRRENPLGKIPALILDDGTVLYDSRVILDYLDHLAGPGTLIPTAPTARFRSLTNQALADGIMEAAVLTVYEGRWREPEHHSRRWLDHQAGKIARALDAFEAAPPTGRIDVGHIALACALGYLDLRLGGRWRAGHPALVRWLGAFAAAVPAFERTKVSPT